MQARPKFNCAQAKEMAAAAMVPQLVTCQCFAEADPEKLKHDLIRATRFCLDGYYIAKELDRLGYYDMDAETVGVLDAFLSVLLYAHEQLQAEWVEMNHITISLKKGTPVSVRSRTGELKTGFIVSSNPLLGTYWVFFPEMSNEYPCHPSTPVNAEDVCEPFQEGFTSVKLLPLAANACWEGDPAMKEMSDKEIKDFLATNLMGWIPDEETQRRIKYRFWCTRVGSELVRVRSAGEFDPLNDMQVAQEVEQKIHELGLTEKYALALAGSEGTIAAAIWKAATASPRERSLAAVFALKGVQVNNDSMARQLNELETGINECIQLAESGEFDTPEDASVFLSGLLAGSRT
jgi:hypothetical protein